MPEKMEYQLLRRRDAELHKQLEKVHWPLEYGIVSIQIRDGKAKLAHIDRTVKLDK